MFLPCSVSLQIDLNIPTRRCTELTDNPHTIIKPQSKLRAYFSVAMTGLGEVNKAIILQTRALACEWRNRRANNEYWEGVVRTADDGVDRQACRCLPYESSEGRMGVAWCANVPMHIVQRMIIQVLDDLIRECNGTYDVELKPLDMIAALPVGVA